MAILETATSFWQKHPALLYGLMVFLGVMAALTSNCTLIIPLLGIAWPLFFWRYCSSSFRIRLFLSLLVGMASFGFICLSYSFPSIPSEGIVGTAVIDISSLSTQTSHAGKKWLYKGTVQSFTSQNEHAPICYNLPYSLTIPYQLEHEPANCSYVIQGRLKQTNRGNYYLIPQSKNKWVPISDSWSLAEYRFHAKQKVSNYIHNHFDHEQVAVFLAGLITGEFDNRMLRFEFGRFGLQHILAISGFHFAIIAAILQSMLRVFCSLKKAVPLLILCLCSYFLFLGTSPSILRAWIAVLLALCGMLIQKPSSGLNAVGVALLIGIFVDPFACQQLGFQFSYTVTAAILLFYMPIDTLLQRWIVIRTLSDAIDMDRWNQYGYILLNLCRKAISLAIAVHLVGIPLSLYCFHKFYWWSLLYNLFFPFLVSISMLLFLLGTPIHMLLPQIGQAVHIINDHYTNLLLNVVYNMPTSADIVWRVSSFPTWILACYLTILFIGGICIKHQLTNRIDARPAFAFL